MGTLIPRSQEGWEKQRRDDLSGFNKKNSHQTRQRDTDFQNTNPWDPSLLLKGGKGTPLTECTGTNKGSVAGASDLLTSTQHSRLTDLDKTHLGSVTQVIQV